MEPIKSNRPHWPRRSGITILLTLCASFLATQVLATPANAAVTPPPAGLDFGEQPVGTTSPSEPVSFSNDGLPVDVTGIATDSASFSAATSDPDCVVLGTGATCTIDVTFSPVAAQTYVGGLTIVTTDGISPFIFVQLEGIGTNGPTRAADISHSPLMLGFGDQPVGSTSAPLSLTITNNDRQRLQITGILASNASFSAGITDPGCDGVDDFLQQGASCTIDVTFTPQTANSYIADLSVTFDASLPLTVGLSGRGRSLLATVQPLTLDFGDQRLATSSAPQPVTWTNSGDANITLFSIGTTGDFSDASTCGSLPATIEPGRSCTISVTFTPITTGTRTGALTIVDDSTSGPHAVTLTGNGVPTSGPCATVRLTATPAVVAPLARETVATSLGSCSGAAEVVKVKVEVSGPRGRTASFGFPIWLRAGQTLSPSVSFPAPPRLGTYIATVTVSSGTTVLGTASASFTVAV